MNLVKKILGRLSGLKYRQEYLCMTQGSFEQPLSAYLLIGGQVIEDITKHHNFIGYTPLIFALSSTRLSSLHPEEIKIAFTARAFHSNDKFSKKDAVALLSMKKIKEQAANGRTIFYFEGVNGWHRFLSSFHQSIIQLRNRLFQIKPGNVFLPGNLYKQVQIAYSVPRNISLITVGQNDQYNLFPTDLHGPVGEDHYIISLRHEGKACAQVMDVKDILLSQVHGELYKTVYSLGKNHMQDMKEKEHFPFSDQLSSHLQLPLPPSALSYRELQLRDSFINGIHRIMLFKVSNKHTIQPGISSLGHIHNVYASWRHNKGLAGNYLLR